MLNRDVFNGVKEVLLNLPEEDFKLEFSYEGYKLNSDMNYVKGIVKGLKRTPEHYCPCKVQQTDENLCPCDEFINTGVCHCKLWIKEEK